MNLKGSFYILLFVIIVALTGVFLGNLNQTLNPAVFLFFSAFVTMIIFGVVSYTQTNFYFIKKANNFKLNILKLNLASLLVWLGYTYALKYVEPAIVVIIANACGPLLIVMLASYMQGSNSLYKIEKIAAIGIALSLVFIIYNNLIGESAVKIFNSKTVLWGVIFAFLTGIGQILYIIFSKNMSDHKFTSSEIIFWRYPLVLIVSLFLLDKSVFTLFLQGPFYSIQILILSIFGMALPVFVFQKGLKLTDPFIVSILMLLEPIIMFIGQTFDPRLKISIHSYIGMALITLFSILSLLGRYYTKKRTILKMQE